MFFRSSHLLVVLFWLVSMGWLVTAKIMPALVGGDRPDYRAHLQSSAAEPESWKIRWNERTIGFAANRVLRGADGSIEVRNIVHFEQLPLEAMLEQLLGPFSLISRSFFDSATALEVEGVIASHASFDRDQQLRRFRAVVDFAQTEDLLTIDGQPIGNGEFEFVARLGAQWPAGSGEQQQVYRQRVRLPPQALISDAVSPRLELHDLELGQSWTMPVYRAFPPNQPIQVVEAHVERHDIIFWEGQDTETKLVVYYADSGADIQSAREPLGREWVDARGVILRQEVRFSGMRIQFERIGEGIDDPRLMMLDAERYPRLWKWKND